MKCLWFIFVVSGVIFGLSAENLNTLLSTAEVLMADDEAW